MKVLFITWSGHNYARDRLQNLKNFHEKLGHKTQWTNFYADDFDSHLEENGLAYMWNGQYPVCQPIKKKLESLNIKIVYVEVAWFPQDNYLYFDHHGTNSECSLLTDDLSWLTDNDYVNLDQLKKHYSGGLEWKMGNYVFVPLQLERDMAVVKGSPFKRMSDFIAHCNTHFKDQNVVFRKHPKDNNNYHINNDGNGDLKTIILNSKLVYGINSTVTLESALMGVPTTTVGTSLLNIGKNKRDALAALVARQVPVNTLDFRAWTTRGRGLEHLLPHV